MKLIIYLLVVFVVILGAIDISSYIKLTEIQDELQMLEGSVMHD